MYNIFEGQDPSFDVNPSSDRLHRERQRRKTRHCESHCTGSRWAAIELGECAGHVEDQRLQNAGDGRAPRAAAALASHAPPPAR